MVTEGVLGRALTLKVMKQRDVSQLYAGLVVALGSLCLPVFL